MKRILYKSISRLLCFLVAVIICITAYFGVQPIFSANAASPNSTIEFNQTNVLDDLSEMTIDGKPFELKDYAFDEKRQPTVLSLVEYCYSFYSERQGNFGLYLYVWNPQGLEFDIASGRNTVELSYADKQDYVKYPLSLCSRSTAANYEGLFYKFKIVMTNTQREEMLRDLNSSERVYHVVGIELLTSGQSNPVDYDVNGYFRYSGYAAGYGPNSQAESTLDYTRESGEVLTIDDGIHQTFFRPEGASNLNGDVQDTLQSIYFSVPNSFFEQYGRLSALRMAYLKCFTHWILLTGRQDVYEGLQTYLGVNTNGYVNGDSLYSYRNSRGQALPSEWAFSGDGVSYNLPITNAVQLGALAYLALVIPTDSWGMDIADDYVVPWETLLTFMQAYHDNFDYDREYWDASYIPPHIEGSDYEQGGTVHFDTPYDGAYVEVGGKTYAYSRALFDMVADSETVIDIPAEKEYSLTNMTVGKQWWDGLFGLDGSYEISSNDYDGIQAIKIVESEDFKSTEQLTCDGLYIDRNDYAEFKTFYNEATAQEETVVIIRYDVSQYQSVEVRQGRPYVNGQSSGWDDSDTNARAFRQYVYLDLDVISLSFDNGEETVVIPVVSDPIDAGSDGTPAIDTSSDKSNWWAEHWWQVVLGALALIILLVILMPILPYLVKAVVWVIALPFKLIGAIFKGIGNAVKKRKRSSAPKSTSKKKRRNDKQ